MSNFKYTRPDSFPPIVKNLVIINVLVFIAQLLLDKQYDLTNKLALWPIIPERLQLILAENNFNYKFQPYQVATHMFTHSPNIIFHIIFNMFTLWMFGRVLENVWGAKRFLLFYILCGLGAAALHLGIQYLRCNELLAAYDQTGPSVFLTNKTGALGSAVGASGAIMGVMAAFAYLFPNTELYIMFIPFPIKAKWAMLGLAAIDLFGGIAKVSGDNIAHFAHLGGAITGFLIVLYWNKTNRRSLY
jgi:membrane associated rhomboid family serine protease